MMISFSDIEAEIEEKHAKQIIETVGSFPLLDTVEESVMLGSFSWYFTKSRQKQILRPFAYPFEKFIATPSELSRTYLGLKYGKQRAMQEQIEIFRQQRTPPLYVRPAGFYEGAYIDLRSAYAQIVQIVGWDADYNPGKWLGKKESMEDFPFWDFKLSRNCLVTAGLPSEAQFWSSRTRSFQSVKTYNRTLNLGIWALVMDVLHCVAWDAVAAGAIYVHTDGYICHRARIEAVQSAISSWGLESGIKAAGRAVVYGVGSYQVGAKVTRNQHITTYPYDSLRILDYHQWLKSRFRALAERTQVLWSNDGQRMMTSKLSNALERSQKQQASSKSNDLG